METQTRPGLMPNPIPAFEVEDHTSAHEAVEAFASLGTSGSHLGNQERDLHRWMSSLWGFSLETYSVSVLLQVWCLKLNNVCMIKMSKSPTYFKFKLNLKSLIKKGLK